MESAADLDEAIECAREIKERASRGGPEYSTTIINLVSHLLARYSKRKDPADLEEAVQLIGEQLSISTPGPLPHGMAILQLGEMSVEKFGGTDAMDDLDEALRQLQAGLATLPRTHDKRFQVESRISKLYSSRHKKSGDFADLRNAVLYSDSAVAAVSPSNPFEPSISPSS